MSDQNENRPALAIVLAAGKGTRMESQLPKVLVPVLGRPMIHYVLDALKAAQVKQIVVVVGYEANLVREELANEPGVSFAEQTEQLGTGHAVMMCREELAAHDGPVLVVAGDSPMLQASSVAKLLRAFHDRTPACLLGTVERENPAGYGRILRNKQGDFMGIKEEKDASETERAIREVNVSTYLFDAVELLHSLDGLSDNNAQKEYYITDCPAILLADGKSVDALKVLEPCESMSINNMEELAVVEEELRRTSGATP